MLQNVRFLATQTYPNRPYFFPSIYGHVLLVGYGVSDEYYSVWELLTPVVLGGNCHDILTGDLKKATCADPTALDFLYPSVCAYVITSR
jgi:hypothetical protein